MKLFVAERDQRINFSSATGRDVVAIINRKRSGKKPTGITLEEVIPRPRTQVGSEIIVYRVHEGEIAEASKASLRRRRNY